MAVLMSMQDIMSVFASKRTVQIFQALAVGEQYNRDVIYETIRTGSDMTRPLLHHGATVMLTAPSKTR